MDWNGVRGWRPAPRIHALHNKLIARDVFRIFCIIFASLLFELNRLALGEVPLTLVEITVCVCVLTVVITTGTHALPF